MSQRRNAIVGWAWKGLKLAAVLAVVGLVVYRVKFTPVPVVEHKLERGEIVAEVLGTGTLEARVKVSISPKISGRIKEILVDQGDRVSVSDEMVRLDNEELTQQVEIAQATLAANRAAVERLKADLTRAEAILKQAKRGFDRANRLKTGNAISEGEVDKAVESLGIAEAGIARANAAIAGGEKQVLTAQKTLSYHQARLSDTIIKAPFDGLVIRRQRDPGDIVVPGSAILTVISLQEIWISAWVDETEMARVRIGESARVVFRSEADRSFQGKVARLGKETDRETREFIVDVQVLELPDNWAVGQRAEVFIETARKSNALLLPTTYVCWHDSVPGVFKKQDNRAIWTPVTFGLRSSEMIEIVEGLQADDTVVSPQDPKTKLTDGKKVIAS